VIIPDETLDAAASCRSVTSPTLPARQADRRNRRSRRAARLATQVPPPEVAALKGKLEHINGDKENAVRDQNFEKRRRCATRSGSCSRRSAASKEAWREGAPTHRPIINEEGVRSSCRADGDPVTGLQRPSTAAVAPHGRGNARAWSARTRRSR